MHWCAKGQLLFTYFHFACDKPLTDAMIKERSHLSGLWDNLQKQDRSLPLLIPMRWGCRTPWLPWTALIIYKDKGRQRKTDWSGIPGVKRTKVLVLGGGTRWWSRCPHGCRHGRRRVYHGYRSRLRQLEMELPISVHPLLHQNITSARSWATWISSSVACWFRATRPSSDYREMLRVDGARHRAGGRSHRPRRMLPNITSNDTPRPRLYRGWHRALCRSKYSGCRAQHIHNGSDQHYVEICRRLGRQGVGARLAKMISHSIADWTSWKAKSHSRPWLMYMDCLTGPSNYKTDFD